MPSVPTPPKPASSKLKRAIVTSPPPRAPTRLATKNAKRREARKKAAENAKDGDTELKGSQADNWREGKQNGDGEAEKKEEVDLEAEREKKARNLKKKLKQAKELKEKSQQDGAKLLPEQFAKVIKINELIRELDQLGFDADGEPKAKSDAKDTAATEDALPTEDLKE
ncbi:RNA-binding protein [Botrytis cinerea]